jgi:hypothetical protein
MTLPKDAMLPLLFAGVGTGYFAVTVLRKPDVPRDHLLERDLQALAAWERHKRDATIGLVAGLAAAGLLWATREREREVRRDSFA